LSFVLLRSFVDLGLLPLNFWTVTPGIWVIALAIYILFAYLKKLKFLKIMQYYLLIALLLVYFTKFKINLINLELILNAFIVSLLFLYPLKLIDKKLECVALAHSLDIATTIVGINILGFSEKHVISHLLGNGVLIMVAKAIVLTIFFYFYRENYLIASICLLGILTGGRNLFIELVYTPK